MNQLSIARNLFLGREPLKGPRILNRMDRGFMEEVTRRLMREVGITKDIPASTSVSFLSGGERQAVAIARAMYFESELIILDEPTNNLGVAETQGVLRFVRNARDSGHSCIFIAHNIHHVFQVVDRIVVLRRGRVVADDIDPQDDHHRAGRAGHHGRPRGRRRRAQTVSRSARRQRQRCGSAGPVARLRPALSGSRRSQDLPARSPACSATSGRGPRCR